MENKKRLFWKLFVILAYAVLGVVWMLLGGSDHKTFESIFGVCWLGLALWRTYLLIRDLKNIPENPLDGSDWNDLS